MAPQRHTTTCFRSNGFSRIWSNCFWHFSLIHSTYVRANSSVFCATWDANAIVYDWSRRALTHLEWRRTSSSSTRPAVSTGIRQFPPPSRHARMASNSCASRSFRLVVITVRPLYASVISTDGLGHDISRTVPSRCLPGTVSTTATTGHNPVGTFHDCG